MYRLTYQTQQRTLPKQMMKPQAKTVLGVTKRENPFPQAFRRNEICPSALHTTSTQRIADAANRSPEHSRSELPSQLPLRLDGAQVPVVHLSFLRREHRTPFLSIDQRVSRPPPPPWLGSAVEESTVVSTTREFAQNKKQQRCNNRSKKDKRGISDSDRFLNALSTGRNDKKTRDLTHHQEVP